MRTAFHPTLVIAAALGITLMGYQNCAPVDFEQVTPTLHEKGEAGDEGLVLDPVEDANDYTESDREDSDIINDDQIADDRDRKDCGNKGGKKFVQTACGDFSDFEITVVALEVIGAGSKVQLVSSQPVSLRSEDLKRGVEFEIDTDLRVQQVRLILADEGNFLLAESGKKVFALKTPSAQQSGLKFQVHKAVQAGVNKLTAEIDLNRQIVSTKKKCIFKPVIHKSQIVKGALL